jgi:nucleoside-diphosphate-sugar epimerase
MPSCFAQPSILRKPLLSAERNATKKAILVTGSTGYIGKFILMVFAAPLIKHLVTARSTTGPDCSQPLRRGHALTHIITQTHNIPFEYFNITAGSRIVERLLACGHNVHVLCRPRASPGPGDMLQYLKV